MASFKIESDGTKTILLEVNGKKIKDVAEVHMWCYHNCTPYLEYMVNTKDEKSGISSRTTYYTSGGEIKSIT